ncbi:MAG: ATP-binding protein [Muribaculaceae bacterium]|nr:ATP-binding protein [Muribaculaceae bacterium]
MFIQRKISESILKVQPFYQIIVVTGPRQSGKSTLCRHLFPEYSYLNLEDLSIRARATRDPRAFLKEAGKQVILDEVQNLPDLLSYIQVMVDEDASLRYVITGSSNFALMESISQSLAGRAALFTLLPLSMTEIENFIVGQSIDKIMFNGFYPSIFAKHTPPEIFYSNYNLTYVERDVRQLLEIRNLDRFAHFMSLCALRVGSELNMSDLAKSVGVSTPTIAEWISILKASYIVFTLSPFYANLQKRLTKRPKLYFYDTGLATYLMGLSDPSQIKLTGLTGALFENAAILELIKRAFNSGKAPRLMFYRENTGKEVDVVDDHGIFVDLYEIKASSTFKQEYTKNMEYVKSLLGDRIRESIVIYDGESQPPSILNIRDI